jgi:uncharacterized protein (DUF2249 family)
MGFAKRFKADHDGPWCASSSIRYRRATRDDKHCRPTLISFTCLKSSHRLQIISLADPGRLKQLIKPIEQYHRERTIR